MGLDARAGWSVIVLGINAYHGERRSLGLPASHGRARRGAEEEHFDA